MAVTNKTSELVGTKLDTDNNFKVLEMEFKFVRYRLIVDNIEQAIKIRDILNDIIETEPVDEIPKEPMPRFYKGK